jgi:Tol biopolymer transport system component
MSAVFRTLPRTPLFCVLVIQVLGPLVSGCETATAPATAEPGTGFADHHELPSWSPGGQLAYRDNGIICVKSSGAAQVDPDSLGVWVLDVSSGQSQLITRGGDTPAWSPDGTAIALASNQNIYVVDPDGANPRRLTTDGRNAFPAWSPIGDSLVYESTQGNADGHRSIWIVSSDGDNQRKVYEFGRMPDWHPGGNRLVFIGEHDTLGFGILEYDLSDHSVRLLVEHEPLMSTPRYSPDGEAIVYSARTGGDSLPQLWLLREGVKSASRLTLEGGSDPAWSRDGAALAYVRTNPDDSGPLSGILWMFSLATAEQHPITSQRSEACP